MQKVHFGEVGQGWVKGCAMRCRFVVEMLENRQMLSAGDFDPTFGTGGFQSVSFNEQFQLTSIYASVLQPDGKTVIAGSVADGNSSRFAVARLLANGQPDTAFNGDGIFVQDSFGTLDSAFGVTLQSDGKIVAVGGVTDEDGAERFYVARLNSDGTPDTSFGGPARGYSADPGSADPDLTPIGNVFFPNEPDDEARAVVIQPNGQIIVSGSAGTGQFFQSSTGSTQQTTFAVVRFNSDGSLDTSFGPNGDGASKPTVSPLFGQDIESALGVALQSDGKIVATGTSSGEFQFITFRLNSNGVLDSNFGFLGFIDSGFSQPGGQAFAIGLTIDVQPDQKILVGGVVIDVLGNNFDFDFRAGAPDGQWFAGHVIRRQMARCRRISGTSKRRRRWR